MARILSYGESTLVALLQIKVLDPVRAFCRSFRLNSPRTSVESRSRGPIAPIPDFPGANPGERHAELPPLQAALLRPFALFKPEQLLIIASREALSQSPKDGPVDQPHA